MKFKSYIEKLVVDRKNVLVVGLGISGVASAGFFRRLGIGVLVVEKMREDDFNARGKYLDQVRELRASGVKVYFGVDGVDVLRFLDSVGLVVVSPGISHRSPVYQALQGAGVKLVTEFELGIELYRELRGARSIVVTGSNGKSTTVSIIEHVLKHAGIPSHLCGNIGTPVVSELGLEDFKGGKISEKVALVVEASSYQLEGCTELKPNIGVLLNVSDNHLERHGNMENYLAAKENLFMRQDGNDIAILNNDDKLVSEVAARVKSAVFYFGRNGPQASGKMGAFFDYEPSEARDQLVLSLGDGKEILDLSDLKLPGTHNRYNAAAAVLSLRLQGVALDCIVSGLPSFMPLEHRIEYVRSAHECLVFNDSKATTVAATVAAFNCIKESFPDKRITLMIGGEAKEGSWLPLMTILKESLGRINPVVCFGRDGEMLFVKCIGTGLAAEKFGTLKGATSYILEKSLPSDVVLFSPGCASFDEFLDFEDRGRKFKMWVK